MKINLITYSCALNYGAMLQTYGLFRYLSDHNHDVKVIDYFPDRYDIERDSYVEDALKHSGRWNSNPIVRTIWKKTKLQGIYINQAVFRQFLERNVALTSKYINEEDLKRNLPEADLYITGSDQVWNSDFVWSASIDKPYYLSFLPDDARRISYSSSFGKNNLPDDEINNIKKYLSLYEKISVRECSGIDILNLMGLDGVEVADPTILAGKNLYDQIIGNQRIIQEDYILYFSINTNRALLKIADKVAKKHNKKIVVVIPDINRKHKAAFYSKCVLPSVEEWVRLIADAECVITDSFHATVFSIMYHRNFIADGTVGYAGRIRNILGKVNLTDHILEDLNEDALKQAYSTVIDYSEVDNVLNEYQKQSRKWLDKAIGD